MKKSTKLIITGSSILLGAVASILYKNMKNNTDCDTSEKESENTKMENGFLYGMNAETGEPIYHDRLSDFPYTGLIIGNKGTGKSTFAINEIVDVLEAGENYEVIVIDQQGSYGELADKYDGQVISLLSSHHINPLELDLEYSDGLYDPLDMKVDHVAAMLEMMYDERKHMSPEEMHILNCCVRNMYKQYIWKCEGLGVKFDHSIAPNMHILKEELFRYSGQKASDMENVLHKCLLSCNNIFDSQSTFKIDNRLTVFNLNGVSEKSKGLATLACLNTIWNRVLENNRKNVITWVYIEDFEKLLERDHTSHFMIDLFKRCRLNRCILTGVVGETDKLLCDFGNQYFTSYTGFIRMFSMGKEEAKDIQQRYNIPNDLMVYITESGSGTGLLYADGQLQPITV